MDKHPEEYADCLERFESITQELSDFFDSTPYTPRFTTSVVTTIGPVRVCCDNGGSESTGDSPCDGCKFNRNDKCALLKLQKLSNRVLKQCKEELERITPAISEYKGTITFTPTGVEIDANVILPDNGKSYSVLQCAVDELYKNVYLPQQESAASILSHLVLDVTGKICRGMHCSSCPLNLLDNGGLCISSGLCRFIEKLDECRCEIRENFSTYCDHHPLCHDCKLLLDGGSCLRREVIKYFRNRDKCSMNFSVTINSIDISPELVEGMAKALVPALKVIQDCIKGAR